MKFRFFCHKCEFTTILDRPNGEEGLASNPPFCGSCGSGSGDTHRLLETIQVPSVPKVIILYQIGSEVLLGDEIKATVIGIEIKHEFRIRYNVAWWDHRNYRDLWLFDFEVKSTDKSKTMSATFMAN